MKKFNTGDVVKVKKIGSGFGIDDIGKKFIILQEKAGKYFGGQGYLVEGYLNVCCDGFVGEDSFELFNKVLKYEIY